MQTMVGPETLKEIKETLKSLPAKQAAVSRSEAIHGMRKELKSAQKNGYTLEELATLLNDKGIDVKAATLRRILSDESEGRRRKTDGPAQAGDASGKTGGTKTQG